MKATPRDRMLFFGTLFMMSFYMYLQAYEHPLLRQDATLYGVLYFICNLGVTIGLLLCTLFSAIDLWYETAPIRQELLAKWKRHRSSSP